MRPPALPRRDLRFSDLVRAGGVRSSASSVLLYEAFRQAGGQAE
jgi:hypothetical protein